MRPSARVERQALQRQRQSALREALAASGSRVQMPWCHCRRGPSVRMERMALRRRRQFASREAALASFAAKPPFSSFREDALCEYVQHGLRDAPGAFTVCEKGLARVISRRWSAVQTHEALLMELEPCSSAVTRFRYLWSTATI